jgi:hypothetical protein
MLEISLLFWVPKYCVWFVVLCVDAAIAAEVVNYYGLIVIGDLLVSPYRSLLETF